MHHVIVTLDYELFGNGTGCLDNCLTRPTHSLMKLLEQYGARLSFFVETLEFDRIRSKARGKLLEQYRAVESQLGNAAANGHKLELHIHPQWLNATQKKDTWQVDMSRWRVGDLTPADFSECLDIALEYLKSLTPNGLGPEVFRAGGWTIQPAAGNSKTQLKLLQEAGVKIDSTVAPGMNNRARGDWFDFRDTPALPFWPIDTDSCQVSQSVASTQTPHLLEVPITTSPVSPVQHALGLVRAKQRQTFPDGCLGDYGGPNSQLDSWRGKLSKIQCLGNIMLDYSTMPAALLIEATKAYIKRFETTEALPIILIGHNKNFTREAEKELGIYLDWVATQQGMGFSNYESWLLDQSITKS